MTDPTATPGASLLEEANLNPMEAANVLYGEGDDALGPALLASLSARVFDAPAPAPSSKLRRRLAGFVFNYLRRTTGTETREGDDGTTYEVYRNRVLERSGHPYATTLLEPSGATTASFVEGGDPMNAPYMMLVPEISRRATRWDRLLLDSVQGKDVQLRFIWETRACLAAAKQVLDAGDPVRIKAAAAGTGLSLILVFNRLLGEGYDPQMISAVVTDRDPANVAKAFRLLDKIPAVRDHVRKDGGGPGISAGVEDLLAEPEGAAPRYHVVTLVGILEYFHGWTCATTEGHRGEPEPEEPAFHAERLLTRVAGMVVDGGTLIANTYRVEMGARILEIFGKRLRYRNREDLHQLAATGGFVPLASAGSGNIYDVEVFARK